MTEYAYRRRIERELHDGLQQDLVALIVNLQLVRRLLDSDPTAAKAALEEIRTDAQKALDESRRLGLRIYPPLLDSAGIRTALQAVAPETAFEVALPDRCPEEVAACVYFCCLDLAADASAITVRGDGEEVVFEAVLTETPDLSRVHDRVEALGGRLTSEPGRVSGVLRV